MSSKSMLSKRNWVHYNKTIARATSINAAVLFGELCDIEESISRSGKLEPDGSFYKSGQEIQDEIAMTRGEFDRAKQLLEKTGLITTGKKHIPGTLSHIATWNINEGMLEAVVGNVFKVMTPLESATSQKHPGSIPQARIPDLLLQEEEKEEAPKPEVLSLKEPSQALLEDIINTFKADYPNIAKNIRRNQTSFFNLFTQLKDAGISKALIEHNMGLITESFAPNKAFNKDWYKDVKNVIYTGIGHAFPTRIEATAPVAYIDDYNNPQPGPSKEEVKKIAAARLKRLQEQEEEEEASK